MYLLPMICFCFFKSFKELYTYIKFLLPLGTPVKLSQLLLEFIS